MVKVFDIGSWDHQRTIQEYALPLTWLCPPDICTCGRNTVKEWDQIDIHRHPFLLRTRREVESLLNDIRKIDNVESFLAVRSTAQTDIGVMFRLTGMGKVEEMIEVAECKDNGHHDYLCVKFIRRFARAFRDLFPLEEIKQEGSFKHQLLVNILNRENRKFFQTD